MPDSALSFTCIGWYTLLTIQVLAYGSYSVLVHLCQENGRIAFNSTCMNFVIELCKLLLAVAAHLVDTLCHALPGGAAKHLPLFDKGIHRKTTGRRFSIRASFSFSIPAFLYFVNNNLAVYIQLYMDSTSYQMLSNLKILTTALLYYLIIGKRMSGIKWCSLAILFLSGVLYSLANMKSLQSFVIDESELRAIFLSHDSVNRLVIDQRRAVVRQRPSESFTRKSGIYITETGFVLILVYCVLSGLSGVYNEYLLKLHYADSIYVQNAYLYAYGCVLNFVAYFAQSVSARDERLVVDGQVLSDFFDGFSMYTWVIVATQVFNGFLMSVVMKHASNITRLFVISCSLIVTTVLSVLVFSVHLNVYYYSCFAAIMLALYLYIFK